jgi:microcin C transport system substrate-binding protein
MSGDDTLSRTPFSRKPFSRLLSNPLSRRRMLILSAGAAAAPALTPLAAAGDETETHGISAFGDLKYPADFQHLDFVNPNAPKGGMFSQTGAVRWYNQNFLTFNSLNAFILKGDGALGLEKWVFATLMAHAWDEPDAMYGLAADKVRISADGLVYRFHMRPEARFHDGSKLTARDVAFSLTILKDKGHPIITQMLRDMLEATAGDDAVVTVRFAKGRARDVPLFIAGECPIFSQAYYTAHPFEQSTLDVPLGSGAYRVGRFEAGRFIEYERVPDWWGEKLPVSVGQNNFDILRYEYYRDLDVSFEGFKAKNYLFREEFASRTWATGYDIPAVRDGRVKRDKIPDDTPSGCQGWFFNTRRAKFANPRLREALNYAFDFEWTNKNIMYGAYQRTRSAFENSNMVAVGPPSPEELVLLEPWRGKVPEQVFGEPFVPPVSDGSGQDRALLRKASQMLTEAGYPVRNGKRVDSNGEPVTIEFLLDEPSFLPHHSGLIKNLAILGIDASPRVVDAVQYKARMDDFDFDITIERMNFSSTPGDSLRTNFSSRAAATKGSQNLAGVASPAVDALIDKIIEANSRAELVIACRTLDRVLRAGHYWIPHWYRSSHLLAYWDVFGHPEAQPRYDRAIPETWWYDRDKASRQEKAG